MTGFTTEPHLWQECIYCILFDLIELVVVQTPCGQKVADAGQPNVAIAHECFVLGQWVESNAFADGVAAFFTLAKLGDSATRGRRPHAEGAMSLINTLVLDCVRVGVRAGGQADVDCLHFDGAQ